MRSRRRATTELRLEILLALFEQIAIDPDKAAQRADEAIAVLREHDEAGYLARALITKFIADAVLGRGASARLLDEALELERGSTGPVSTYPLLWFHWIDDLEATRARHHVHDQRYRDRGDIVTAAETAEFLAMAEFRAGNWTEAEKALEDACETLAQFDLRGPFVASFADRSVIDAHRGRIERARQTLLGILDDVDRLDVFWRSVCHSAQGAVEFCGGDYGAADRSVDTDAGGGPGRRLDRSPDDRSEPDHVEALIALGRLDEAHRVLDHLEWRGRTLPRSWIDAGLPRARALLLASDGKLAEALGIIDAAP